MKTNQIIAEGIVGMSLELSITDIIVLNSRLAELQAAIGKDNNASIKSRDMRVYANRGLLEDIAIFISKITDNQISLEKSESDLFKVQEVILP